MTDALEDLIYSVQQALIATRIVGKKNTYAWDNPAESALVFKYLQGGARPAVATAMGRHLVSLEDARRKLAAPVPEPEPVPPPAGGCYWGARIDGAFYAQPPYNAGDAIDAPWGLSSWNLFEEHAGKRVSLIHWGGSGTDLIAFDTNANKLCHDRGAFSAYTMGLSTQQVLDFANWTNVRGAISKGEAWATAAKSQGWPIMLRPMWEMNGNWGYPWQTAAGIAPSVYVAAWKGLHAAIAPIAPNVSWHWCPNVKSATVPDPTPWYPGDDYVDWVGMDGYCYGTYVSPESLFGPTLDICKALSAKPLMIGEVGCEAPTSTPGKAVWIDEFLTWAQFNGVRAFSWFNESGNPKLPQIEVGDTATEFGGKAQTAFRTGIADPHFLANVAGGFPAGGKVPVP